MGIESVKLSTGETVERFIMPVPELAAELALKESEPPQAIIPGCVYAGHVTLFSGAPKAGKSTIVRDWLRRIHRASLADNQHYPFMLADRMIPKVNTLVISEESAWAWENFSAEVGAEECPACLDWLFVLHRGHKGVAPSSSDELDLWVDTIISYIDHLSVKLVVIDPVSRFGAINCENDNSEVLRAMMAFERIASESGAGVLLMHHTTKGGNEPRGGGAWQQQPDVLLTLRSLGDKEDIEIEECPDRSRLRLLTGKGRFAEIESNVVCWMDDESMYHGTTQGVFSTFSTAADRDGELIMRHLYDSPLANGGAAIREATGLEANRFGRAMRALVSKNLVLKSGTTKNATYTVI